MDVNAAGVERRFSENRRFTWQVADSTTKEEVEITIRELF
jgi:hypothetical protein